ncbi:hypothetical protein J3Q64DRAFT_1701284 [Phycomyces blakesleeanus]|uniref:Uncharacterized protein n=1 Tax=Phycomyces blakesleeanus TaxID=4837 RepID=A0ABR3ASD9_PHYBL
MPPFLGGCCRSHPQTCDRRNPSGFLRVHQPSVSGPQIQGRVLDGVQSKEAEQIYVCASLEDGDYTRGLSSDPPICLFDIPQPVGWFATYIRPQSAPKIPQLQIRWHHLVVMNGFFRPVGNAMVFHQDDKKFESAPIWAIGISWDSTKELQTHINILYEKLEPHSCIVNQRKLSFIPSQGLKHLGYALDTKTIIIKILGAELINLRRSIRPLISSLSHTLRLIHNLTMYIKAATIALFPAYLNTQYRASATRKRLMALRSL